MAFYKNMDHIFFALFLTFAVLLFPPVSLENIDCKGKAFNCVNSTHFKICVDFGGGVSKTVDDFLIPCPTNTVCRDINIFECEQPATTTLAPSQQSDATNEDIELIFSPSFEEVNVTTLLPDYKINENSESKSDNLRNSESSSSTISEDTTNLMSSTTLGGSLNQVTFSSENTHKYNKQSDLSDSVTVPYTSESGLNLVTNSDKFSTIAAKVKYVNDNVLNSLTQNNVTNNTDNILLEKSIRTIEDSTTEKNLHLVKLINSADVNIDNENERGGMTNLVPISTFDTETESLSTQSEISDNNSPSFTESTYVTIEPDIFAVPVKKFLSNFNIENNAINPLENVVNFTITTESVNTDREQSTKSNVDTFSNSTNVYQSPLKSDFDALNNSRNVFTKDCVTGLKENLSTLESTRINDSTKKKFTDPLKDLINTDFTITVMKKDQISGKKETLSLLTDFPSTMPIKEIYDDTNDEKTVKNSVLTSTTYYNNNDLLTLTTTNNYDPSFKHVTSLPDYIEDNTEKIATIAGSKYRDNFNELGTTTSYVDISSKTVPNPKVASNESLPIESLAKELLETSTDNVLANSETKTSKKYIPIELQNSNNSDVATNSSLLYVNYTSTENIIPKATDERDVNVNKTTRLNENTYTDTTLWAKIYNISNSSESNKVSLKKTTISLTPLTNVISLNDSVNITSQITLQYSMLPESTTTSVSEMYQKQKNPYYAATSPTYEYFANETNTENVIYRAAKNYEATENKISIFNEKTFTVTTPPIEIYNATDSSKSNIDLFQETTFNLMPLNNSASLNIDVELNSNKTLRYTSLPEILENQTNSYSAVTNPVTYVPDTTIDNNIHTVVDYHKILENKATRLTEHRDTVTASVKETYDVTESSQSFLASLPVSAVINDVTSIGADLNLRQTLQSMPLSQQSAITAIYETYKNQENLYSITSPVPNFKDNEKLSTIVTAPIFSTYDDITNEVKILDDVPNSDNVYNVGESAIIINNPNNDNLNLHSSSLIVSTEKSSIYPSTKLELNKSDSFVYENKTASDMQNMTTNSNLWYSNNENNKLQLDKTSVAKNLHTTPLNVEFNISNVSVNKINTTANSNSNNFNQTILVLSVLKQEFTITPVNENEGNTENNNTITTTESLNSNLFLTSNKKSTIIYPITQNSSHVTIPNEFHNENATTVATSHKKNDYNRNDKENETILNTDTNLPPFFSNMSDSVSEVKDKMSNNETRFKPVTKVTKSSKTDVTSTSYKTTSNRYNSSIINTNNINVNKNNTTATINTIDDTLINFHNVQKIAQRTSNDTSTLDTENIRAGLANETVNEGLKLTKMLKLSTNHSTLKYENASPLKHNETDSNEKFLETQNVSFKNSSNFLRNSEQDTKYYKNDIKTQPLAITIISSLSNESKRNISDINRQSTPLVSQFSCFNRDRGKYSDKNNCTKFYICMGKLEAIKGMCPSDTVFSEINKQCTKNLTHCIRNNEFRCTTSGRFIDVFSEKFYFICVRNLTGFIRFKLQCQKGYHLNKKNIKCVHDSDSLSIEESISKTSSDVSTDEKLSKEFKQSEKYTKPFDCMKEGKFEHPDDCRKYFVCKKGSKSEFRRKVKKCDSDEVFNKEKRKCVDSDTSEC